MRVLGRLEGKVDAVVDRIDKFEREFASERKASSESRHDIHQRIDAQSDKISEVEKTLVAAGGLVAQQRDVIAGLKDTIDNTITPAVSDWGKIKTLGVGFSGLLVALGFTGASLWIWAGDTLGALVKKWLKIE